MIDTSQLEILDKLYKVILSPENWGSVLDDIGRDIGAFGINVLVSDKIITDLQQVWITPALEPSFKEYMERGFFRIEAPTMHSIPEIIPENSFMSVNELAKQHNEIRNDAVDYGELNHWLKHEHSIHNRYIAPMNNQKNSLDTICVSFGDHPPKSIDRSLERCRFYLPHLANLVNISRPFMLLKARFNAVIEVLDRFHLGVFLLSAKGEVIEQNQAAENIIAQEASLVVRSDKKLTLRDEIAQLEFQSALQKAMDPKRVRGKVHLFAPNDTGDITLLLDISPIMHQDLPVGVIVIAIDPENKAIINTSHFSELFSLTPTEQDVCQLLAEGYQTKEIGEIRSTGLETVRSQIKSILTKTGSKRQSDLLRLAFNINIPVDKQTVLIQGQN